MSTPKFSNSEIAILESLIQEDDIGRKERKAWKLLADEATDKGEPVPVFPYDDTKMSSKELTMKARSLNVEYFDKIVMALSNEKERTDWNGSPFIPVQEFTDPESPMFLGFWLVRKYYENIVLATKVFGKRS